MLHGLLHLLVVLLVALGQPLPLVRLAAYVGVPLGLNFSDQFGAALLGLLDPLRFAVLPVEGFLHVLAGHYLERATESLGRNVGAALLFKVALYRPPVLPLAVVEFGQLALQIEILAEFQPRP